MLRKDHPGSELEWKLLNWAYAQEKAKKREIWPCDLPRPDHNEDSDEVKKATALFLYVMGFILLHEIGHIVKGHQTHLELLPNEIINGEFEADMWAAEHILCKWKEYGTDENIFFSRINGITLALALLSGIELRQLLAKEQTHPKVPERLVRIYETFIPDMLSGKDQPKKSPIYIATIILSAYLINIGAGFDYQKDYGTYDNFFVEVSRAF